MKLRTAVFTAILGIVVIGGGLFALRWWQTHRHLETTDNAYVKASTTVISPNIDGYVEVVHVENNMPVETGDLLVTFDAKPFQAAVEAAEAEVESARAEVAAAEANLAAAGAAVEHARERRQLQGSLILQAEAAVEAASARADQAARELTRAESLRERQVGSEQRYEQAATEEQFARAELRRARAELAAAQDELAVIDSEIKRLEAVVKQIEASVGQRQAELARAEAQLRSARIELSHTEVRAPIDGVVGNRIVEPGVYMEAGWPMLSVVPLAGVWVVANFKETQLTDVRVGQKVELTVDAFPGVRIEGRVHSMAPASAAEFSLLPPQNASGNFVKVVQRVPVKIVFDVPPAISGRLVPGLSTIATIDTRTAPEGAALAAER